MQDLQFRPCSSTHTTTSSSNNDQLKPKDDTFNILQFNANGIGNKLSKLECFLEKHNVKVAAIQESKLTSKSRNPNIKNFTTVRRDRPQGQGGGPKEYSLHVVGLLLLQRSTNCTHSSCPPQWGPVSTVFWAGRPSGPAGWLAQLLLKAGDVETNPGPKHTRTQVWICDICHREITRKQTSLRCNHSEHWVHLRCAHIRVDQYTDT